MNRSPGEYVVLVESELDSSRVALQPPRGVKTNQPTRKVPERFSVDYHSTDDSSPSWCRKTVVKRTRQDFAFSVFAIPT